MNVPEMVIAGGVEGLLSEGRVAQGSMLPIAVKMANDSKAAKCGRSSFQYVNRDTSDARIHNLAGT
jgi:hypothetical protein